MFLRNIILDVYRQIDFKDFHIHEFNSSSNIFSYVKENRTKNIYVLYTEYVNECNGLRLGKKIRFYRIQAKHYSLQKPTDIGV